jgi:hypothetical protein
LKLAAFVERVDKIRKEFAQDAWIHRRHRNGYCDRSAFASSPFLEDELPVGVVDLEIKAVEEGHPEEPVEMLIGKAFGKHGSLDVLGVGVPDAHRP